MNNMQARYQYEKLLGASPAVAALRAIPGWVFITLPLALILIAQAVAHLD